ARRLLFHRVEQIDQIVAASHFVGAHLGLLEEAQALQTHPRLLNLGSRRWSRFHLTHFAAQYFIRRARVAAETDAPHIGALARIDEELEIDRIRAAIDLRDTGHLGKVVAVIAQALGD